MEKIMSFTKKSSAGSEKGEGKGGRKRRPVHRTPKQSPL
jgi:hypothetical protein